MYSMWAVRKSLGSLGGNWFIVTLVTHSSGVSRGIHHKWKHLLNPTRLYVFGWVESESSVLFEKLEHVWMIYQMLGLCSSLWLLDELFYSSLPCLFVWLSCMWLFSFAMIINLLMGVDVRGFRGQQGNGDSAA